MEMKYTKRIVLASFIWKLMERSGVQGIQFIVQLVLARLLLPEDFGVIAIVTVFISIANVFVQSGLNTALIQKKEADDRDFSSVLYISLLISGFLYIVIFFLARPISDFYQEPQLIPILRILSITLFFGAFNSVQNAYVARHMKFKSLFFSSLGAVIISGTTGIIAAFLGLGVWALVLQQLINQLVISTNLWFTVKWRPKLYFSVERVKSLFSFGWKLLASNLIHVLYMNLRTLVIGKVYTPSALGFYNRGEAFPKIIVENIDGSIQSVMLPTFSAYQDKLDRLKSMVRRTVVTSSFFVFPAMVGLAVIAEPLIKIVLTDKWLDAVPFLQIFCLGYSFLPIQNVNLQAISAMGRSDITLKLQIIKKACGLIILVITVPLGVHAIAIGAILSAFVSMLLNIQPNRKLLNYGFSEQIKDVSPALFISILMGAIVYFLNFLDLMVWVKLIVQIISGVVIYIGLAKLFKIESLEYFFSIIKGIKNKI